jgi:hypothetical protein
MNGRGATLFRAADPTATMLYAHRMPSPLDIMVAADSGALFMRDLILDDFQFAIASRP